MKVRFMGLKVGDRFYVLGSEHIKISDRTYGGQLSSRPINAINLDNNHGIVIGDKLLVEKRDG